MRVGEVEARQQGWPRLYWPREGDWCDSPRVRLTQTSWATAIT